MRAGLLFVSLVSLLAVTSACGVEEGGSGEVERELIAEERQGVVFWTSCIDFPGDGYCPPGYYAAYKTCSYLCTASCSPFNAWECLPIPDPAGSITASPSTVPVPTGSLGTTRICWNTNVANSQVYVSVDGGTETLFAEATSGCQNAPWIQVGPAYDFKLYAGRAHSNLLAQVRVTGTPYTPQPPTCGPCNAGYDCRCGDICRPLNMQCP